LADGVDILDRTGAFGGAARGVSPKGHIFPPIIFPNPPIDTSGGTKVSGASRAPITKSSDSDTDSMEDEEEEDFHKLRKLAHAAIRQQPITVEISGDYPWGR
jgi:hypothetical protein